MILVTGLSPVRGPWDPQKAADTVTKQTKGIWARSPQASVHNERQLDYANARAQATRLRHYVISGDSADRTQIACGLVHQTLRAAGKCATTHAIAGDAGNPAR